MRAPYGKAFDEFLSLREQETDECILWPYSHNGVGYGEIRINRKKRYTHRLSCELSYGTPPAEAEAAHSCHTPACFNPRHLRWATRAENQMDKVADGTSNRGERCAAAKLNEQYVRWIRESTEPIPTLARLYGVSPATIHDVKAGRTWGWLV